MKPTRFFEKPDQQNLIKTQMVTKYFEAWANVMLPIHRSRNGRIAYVDLFSGPGRFENGDPSTPLMILQRAIEKPDLCAQLTTTFNDKNPDYAAKLQTEIEALPGIEKLKHRPQVSSTEVSAELVEMFRGLQLVPTLFFIDPWGYKGLSLDLIGTAIKSWGCDCVFFFNYNRINPAVANPFVDERMKDLFGSARLEQLRQQVAGRTSADRQTIIIDQLTEALMEVGGGYVLPFLFDSKHGERPSHYVIFVSKSFRGYHIMKEVMAGLSSDDEDVKNFQYVPVKSTQMSFFNEIERIHSIQALRDLLAIACAGTTLSVEQVYESNTVGTPYTFKNVQNALLDLESEGRIAVDTPREKRPWRNKKPTLAKTRLVTFPTRKG